jgi:hypothetical protein
MRRRGLRYEFGGTECACMACQTVFALTGQHHDAGVGRVREQVCNQCIAFIGPVRAGRQPEVDERKCRRRLLAAQPLDGGGARARTVVSKSVPSTKDSESAMSGSSSTMSRRGRSGPGLGGGAAFGVGMPDDSAASRRCPGHSRSGTLRVCYNPPSFNENLHCTCQFPFRPKMFWSIWPTSILHTTRGPSCPASICAFRVASLLPSWAAAVAARRPSCA